ncbi:MAG TPA: tetratricopeptide repeat protein, partial [Candidatus Saccharimonadales bacterium]|nr:tetratricopeptide repeat protein [Candidatus Saccharimonadales bacterium]
LALQGEFPPFLCMEAETSQTQSTDTYYKVLAWLHANQKRLLIGIGVVVGLGLIAAFIAWKKGQDAADANARLFELPVASAPSMAVIAPAPSAYLDLAREYPTTSAGEYAVLFGAESLFINGNYPESQQEFSKYIEDHPESPLVAQAKVGVAACLEAEGKASDAIKKYTEIVSGYPSDLSISGPAKLTLARLYEQENRPDQALTFYSELARSQNPYDPWAAEARERGELLLAKHPELRRTGPAPSPAPFSIPEPANPPASPPPAATPAPETKPANPTLNLLNFPAASSNTTGKP